MRITSKKRERSIRRLLAAAGNDARLLRETLRQKDDLQLDSFRAIEAYLREHSKSAKQGVGA